MLESPELTDITEHTIDLNGYSIWIANKYFGFGKSHNNSKVPNAAMVSRRTAILLSDLLDSRDKIRRKAEPKWYSEFMEKHQVDSSPLMKALEENDQN